MGNLLGNVLRNKPASANPLTSCFKLWFDEKDPKGTIRSKFQSRGQGKFQRNKADIGNQKLWMLTFKVLKCKLSGIQAILTDNTRVF